jgi:predicted nucleic acid-binding protein
MYLLDTSAVIELVCGSKKGEQIVNLTKDKSLAITSFTVHELWIGLKTGEKETLSQFLKEVSILDFDWDAAIKSAEIELELKNKGTLINKTDIFISGICKANDFDFVTCDVDFSKVKGLKLNLF